MNKYLVNMSLLNLFKKDKLVENSPIVKEEVKEEVNLPFKKGDKVWIYDSQDHSCISATVSEISVGYDVILSTTNTNTISFYDCHENNNIITTYNGSKIAKTREELDKFIKKDILSLKESVELMNITQSTINDLKKMVENPADNLETFIRYYAYKELANMTDNSKEINSQKELIEKLNNLLTDGTKD